MTFKQHKLSAIFPSLPDEELKALADDIKTHGLRSPITLFKGQVLDGWHRYRACVMAGVNPRTIDYNGSDPVAFVRSANWHRRHLSASQRALAATQLFEWATEGKKSYTSSNDEVKTNAQMAANAGVSEASITRAKVVEAKGAPALKAAVKEGTITVDKAAKIAKLPKAAQARAMKVKPAPVADPRDEEIEGLKESLADMTHMAASLDSFKNEEAVKDMVALRAELRSVKRRRDELMTECAELKKQVKFWRGKAEKKAA